MVIVSTDHSLYYTVEGVHITRIRLADYSRCLGYIYIYLKLLEYCRFTERKDSYLIGGKSRTPYTLRYIRIGTTVYLLICAQLFFVSSFA